MVIGYVAGAVSVLRVVAVVLRSVTPAPRMRMDRTGAFSALVAIAGAVSALLRRLSTVR